MKQIFKAISHIGIIVKDLYSVISNYSNKYGIGPWSIYDSSSKKIESINVNELNNQCNYLTALCYLDSVGFEIIQPLDRNNIFFEFLENRGEYLHSVSYEVDNSLEASDQMQKNGLKILMSGSFFNNNFVYFNSQSELNHVIKISERNPDFFKRAASKFGVKWLIEPEPSEIYPSPEKQKTMIKPIFKRVVQVSFIVKNIDEMMQKYYKYYGIGPWVVYELGPHMVQDMTTGGKKKDYKFKIAIARIGDIDFELVQPMDEESIFYEFLNKHEGGFHHVAYEVDNFKETMNYMDELSIRILGGGNLEGKHKFIYLTTADDLKHLVELNETEPGYKFPPPTYCYPVK